MSKEKVILVDKNDIQVGLMPKLEAHQKGLLHRAFSIFKVIWHPKSMNSIELSKFPAKVLTSKINEFLRIVNILRPKWIINEFNMCKIVRNQ